MTSLVNKKPLALFAGFSFILFAQADPMPTQPPNNSDNNLIDCGQSGTADQKIQDCQNKNGDHAKKEAYIQQSAQNYSWILVSKLSEAMKISSSEIPAGATWMDQASHLQWFPTLVDPEEQSGALDKCHDMKLRLPSYRNFKVAEGHGIRQVLSNLEGNVFWSSTASSDADDDSIAAWFYVVSPTEAYLDDGNKNVPHSVLCVQSLSR